ncbi:uncharacterized protein LOC129749193 isoform X2 [Uranotaenia lowii]|uniref:uncharacterized protein LOC129749193 isoform X2 n=1 Tax=Uranotaenia lowii TaxID=190385 RepID=UPI00247ADB80|nr:uncharacterized protein LOC129749193 isoform X2 [Uranotaenia lowii]
MGVMGLVTFLSRLPGGCRAVNVLDEIRNSGKDDPLIVLDLLTLICSLSGPIDEQIYGCRNQFAWTYMTKFCDRMLEAGARLVFFMDGKLQEGKYKHWLQRQDKLYGEHLKKLEKIPPEWRGKDRGNVPGNVSKHAFIAALVSAARKKGVLITTYDAECDTEIALFAKKHDAFAIFTGDSDFLIFEGKWRLWSSADLDLDEMRTFEWDKEVLRTTLKLDWNQMPFFAVLSGNDMYKNRPSLLSTFYKVAQRVIDLGLRSGKDKITIDLYQRIYGKRDENQKNSMEDALKLYDLNVSVKKPLVPAEMRHFPNYAICILRNIPNSIRLPCLDLRDAEYSQIALQIYRRQVGILFRHRPVVYGQTLTSPIFIKPGHFASYKIIAVTPITPPIGLRVPKPEELYSLDSEVSSNLVMTKLKLLCWLTSDTLSVEDVFYIHPNYLLDVLTLYFLVENNLIDVITADIILVVIHDCLANTIPRVLPLLRPRMNNLKVCHIYNGFYAQLYFCAETVGLRKELDSYFLSKFDGVYFNAIVDQLRYDYSKVEETLSSLSNLRLYARLAVAAGDCSVGQATIQDRMEQLSLRDDGVNQSTKTDSSHSFG